MLVKPDTLSDLFETASLGAPQNAVGFVLWRVLHRYQRALDQALRPLDLTHLQFVTLTIAAWMARSGQAATQAEIARFGDIHPMQVSAIVQALDRKRLVRRTPAPGRAVAKSVQITQAGVDALRHALPRAIDVQSRIFGDQGRPGGTLLDALVAIDQDH